MTACGSLTAGPELDLAVLRAIGYDGKIVEKYQQPDGSYKHRFVVVIGEENPTGRPIWQPSTDLNDAFLAAEKFGLFDGTGFARTLAKSDSKWTLVWNDYGDEALPFETSPALAICSAIITLSSCEFEPKGPFQHNIYRACGRPRKDHAKLASSRQPETAPVSSANEEHRRA